LYCIRWHSPLWGSIQDYNTCDVCVCVPQVPEITYLVYVHKLCSVTTWQYYDKFHVVFTLHLDFKLQYLTNEHTFHFCISFNIYLLFVIPVIVNV
jgi:hypothetical protein